LTLLNPKLRRCLLFYPVDGTLQWLVKNFGLDLMLNILRQNLSKKKNL
jgi:hypothetical protein